MSRPLPVVALAALLLAAQAAWAAKPVIDHSNLRVNRQTADIVRQNQQTLSVILRNLDALRKGHGDAGFLEGLIHSTMRLVEGRQHLGGAARDLGGLAPPNYRELLRTGLQQVGLPEAASRPDFASVSGAQDFIRQTLEPEARSSAQADVIRSRRVGVYGEATRMALALAIHNRQTATRVPERLAALAGQAARANTTRDQQAVNAALTIALIEEVAALRGLMAAFVHMEAARAHTELGITFAGSR